VSGKIVLVSHKGNHFEQLKDISNTTIDIVSVNGYDEGVLRKLFDFFETTEQRNKIDVISLENFLESKILPNRVVYAFFLNPLSSTSHKIFKTRIQKLPDFSVVLFRPNFMLVPEGHPMKVHKNQWF
jgi:hypothetical protein